MAMSILGSIAVWQIKQSNGRLYGLRLAAAEALVFPLLVLCLLVGIFSFELLTTVASVREEAARTLSVIPAVLIGLVAAAVAWRAIVGRPVKRMRPPLPLYASNQPIWLGVSSLYAVLAGLIVPVLLSMGFAFLRHFMPLPIGWGFVISFSLGVVLEIIAFGCGIVARRTTPGQVGMIISGIFLILTVLFVSFVLPSIIRATTP